MREITSQQVIAERNRRLMCWVADELELKDPERWNLYTEMKSLFKHSTENEQAEYLWEKLSSRNTVRTLEAAKEIMMRFHDIALGWLNNTTEDLRN